MSFGMKVVLVILDGVGDDVARDRMGYMEHLAEEGVAGRFTSRAALPTVSRPNYETIHTGVRPHVHGIVSNLNTRVSTLPNIFSLSREAGLTTAAVAFHWVSELYHRAPFDPFVDLEYDDPDSDINHGRFYFKPGQPDRDVIWGGVALSKRFAPDYLLVHALGADHAGHTHGGHSVEYRAAVAGQDYDLAIAIPHWRDAGYTVLVTADHGHNSEDHGGTSEEERNVPLYAVPPTDREVAAAGDILEQTQIAPTICELLGLKKPDSMTADPIQLWSQPEW
jgi:predicted AlkP superfamily pyrophosphatase or phosphodiesterase